jgi:hypothetical protein
LNRFLDVKAFSLCQAQFIPKIVFLLRSLQKNTH